MTPAWLSGRFDQAVMDAAAFEVERRAEAYPPAIADGRMDEVTAQGDYVAWIAIHEWLAKGQSAWTDWPAMEAAAAKALATIDAKVVASADLPADEAAIIFARRGNLFAIHYAVQRMRTWLEETNRQLREMARANQALAPAKAA